MEENKRESRLASAIGTRTYSRILQSEELIMIDPRPSWTMPGSTMTPGATTRVSRAALMGVHGEHGSIPSSRGAPHRTGIRGGCAARPF